MIDKRLRKAVICLGTTIALGYLMLLPVSTKQRGYRCEPLHLAQVTLTE